MHPAKVTVMCAFHARGVIGLFFYETDQQGSLSLAVETTTGGILDSTGWHYVPYRERNHRFVESAVW